MREVERRVPFRFMIFMIFVPAGRQENGYLTTVGFTTVELIESENGCDMQNCGDQSSNHIHVINGCPGSANDHDVDPIPSSLASFLG